MEMSKKYIVILKDGIDTFALDKTSQKYRFKIKDHMGYFSIWERDEIIE